MVFLIIICVLNVLTLLCLFFVGAYLVRLRDQIIDILELLSKQNVKPVQTQNAWEAKYEAELDAIKKRLQADSGLVDLSLPKVRPVE